MRAPPRKGPRNLPARFRRAAGAPGAQLRPQGRGGSWAGARRPSPGRWSGAGRRSARPAGGTSRMRDEVPARGLPPPGGAVHFPG